MKNINFESNNFFANILDNQHTDKNNENITDHDYNIGTKSYPESYYWNSELYDYIFRNAKKLPKENPSSEESHLKTEKSQKNKNKNLFTSKIFIKQKRGRKKEKIENKNFHTNKSTDNILRKIQVHYLSFIIDFVNDILRLLNYKQKFYPLEQKFKKKY